MYVYNSLYHIFRIYRHQLLIPYMDVYGLQVRHAVQLHTYGCCSFSVK